jgi:CheY-like chemotaxis protein
VSPILTAIGGAFIGAAIAYTLSRRAAARVRKDAERAQAAADANAAELRARQSRAMAKLEREVAKKAEQLDRELQQIEERARELAATEDAEQTRIDPTSFEMARVFSRELATIVSGIEGGTFRLIEQNPGLRVQNDSVESLWLAVRRLRRFHGKVASFAHAPHPTPGSVQIDRLLTSLREELESNSLGLQITWNLPQPSLRLRGDHDDLLLALTLATTALHCLERGALRLSAHVEPNFEHETPEVHVQLVLERDEDVAMRKHPTQPSASFLIARTAAAHMLRAYGATLKFTHEPFHEASAVLQIPLETSEVEATVNGEAVHAQTDPMPTATEEPIVELPRTHRYGGVLVIEEDASVRTMLTAELRSQGRAVFVCPDGASARSLIQATPDRFEILIVDHAARLDAGDLLCATIRKLCPALRIVVLSAAATSAVPAGFADQLTEIRKPFGVGELRRALMQALTA